MKLTSANARFAPGMLAAPLVIFLFCFFLIPLSSILLKSIETPEVRDALPNLSETLSDWDGQEVPGDDAFKILREDLVAAYADKTLPDAAQRINLRLSGARSLVMKTGRQAKLLEQPTRESFEAIDARWGELETWRVIKSTTPRYSIENLLRIVGFERAHDGNSNLIRNPDSIFVAVLLRTLWIGMVVTLFCLVLGFPMAFAASRLPPKWGTVVLVCVLLPFWMSLLVRTGAWMVLLQREGALNSILVSIGVIDAPVELIFNRIGVYISMVHVLLPFMVLPIYSVMRGIGPERYRAAQSLGATRFRAFISVYIPDTMPGVGAGILLVYILAIGFYITPALIGGSGDQMLSYLISQYANRNANFGLASALALLLIVPVGIVSALVIRFTGFGIRSFQ